MSPPATPGTFGSPLHHACAAVPRTLQLSVVQKMSLSGMLARVLERIEEMRAEAVEAAAREAALREHVAAQDADIAALGAEVERLQILEAEVLAPLLPPSPRDDLQSAASTDSPRKNPPLDRTHPGALNFRHQPLSI